jgi:hypothetical protein
MNHVRRERQGSDVPFLQAQDGERVFLYGPVRLAAAALVRLCCIFLEKTPTVIFFATPRQRCNRLTPWTGNQHSARMPRPRPTAGDILDK